MKDPRIQISTDCGWTTNGSEGNLTIDWSKLPDVAAGCWSTFVKCSCKLQCTGNCSCYHVKLILQHYVPANAYIEIEFKLLIRLSK